MVTGVLNDPIVLKLLIYFRVSICKLFFLIHSAKGRLITEGNAFKANKRKCLLV